MVALEAIHNVKGTVFISQQLLQTSIIVSSMWLIRENSKGYVTNKMYLAETVAQR